MFKYKIFLYPSYQMIFKCSFDYLMKEVRRDELIDIRTWEIICEWLYEIMLDRAL
jgi:hypothetical protein